MQWDNGVTISNIPSKGADGLTEALGDDDGLLEGEFDELADDDGLTDGLADALVDEDGLADGEGESAMRYSL